MATDERITLNISIEGRPLEVAQLLEHLKDRIPVVQVAGSLPSAEEVAREVEETIDRNGRLS